MSRLVVGFRDRASSLGALRWAIRVAHEGALHLRVVHASGASIAVRNGPSSAVALELGNPQWATVHSLVQGLDAPVDAETIVKPGAPEAVLRSFVDPDDIVVLGERSRWPSRDLKKRLELSTGATVIRITDGDLHNLSLAELSDTLIGAEQ